MAEYAHVEKPFLVQLDQLNWTVVNQGIGFRPDIGQDAFAAMGVAMRMHGVVDLK